jgi:hypothetical protein
MYLAKVEKKGRTKEEMHRVIEWLTGCDDKKLQELPRPAGWLVNKAAGR